MHRPPSTGHTGRVLTALSAGILLSILVSGSGGGETGADRLGAVLEASSEFVGEDHRDEIRRLADDYDIRFALAQKIDRAARSEDVPRDLAFRLVRRESRFRGDAVSSIGAVGLTQIRPGPLGPYPDSSRSDLMDPETNLRLGFRYLRELRDDWGTWRLALISYHRGPTRTHRERVAGRGHGTSEAYARAVLR